MHIYQEKENLIPLQLHEQRALDALNGKRMPGQLYPFGYYEARKDAILHRVLCPEEVLTSRGLATCAGFGMKLAKRDHAQNQNSFVLAHISEHPALSLLAMFSYFRHHKYTVEEITVSSQKKGMAGIMIAIWLEHAQNLIRGFNLNPKITLIDSREDKDFSGLILTSEGGVLLTGDIDLGKSEPDTPKGGIFKYYSAKRWSWQS